MKVYHITLINSKMKEKETIANKNICEHITNHTYERFCIPCSL